ncbi:MAG: hypothetical protein RBQ97_09790, partial [Acholeplasma sp.]|nr:hypothetical protein [Acholeplasma sp.]
MDSLTKTNYIETMNRIINSLRTRQLITSDLINIVENIELKTYILNKAEEKLQKMFFETLRFSDSAIIITALSIIALEKYDANFWEHVHEEFITLYSNSKLSTQIIDSNIRNLIRDFIPKDYSQSTLIGWVLLHPIVPEKYLLDFYSILSIVYLYDLRHQIPEDISILEGLLKTIFKQIEKKTIQSEDNIQSKIMNQSYKFIRSTREVVTTPSYRNTLAVFARNVILSIASKVNFHEELRDIPQFYIKWADKWFETTGKVQIENRRKSNSSNDSEIKWSVEFGFENQILFLHTKTIFLSPDTDYSKVKIEILSNDECVYFNEKPRIIENDLSYELSTLPILVDFDPFNLTIIIHGTDIKTEKLVNDSLLFTIDTGKRVTSKLSNYSQLFIISKTFNSDNIYEIESKKHYKVGVLEIAKLDYYISNNQHKSIRESDKPYLIGKIHNQISFKYGEEYYDTCFGQISYFFTPFNSEKDYLLWINKKFIELRNIIKETTINIPNSMLNTGLNEIYLSYMNYQKITSTRIIFFYDTRLKFNLVDNAIYFHSTKITSKIKDVHLLDKIELSYSLDKSFVINPFIPMVKELSGGFICLGKYMWHTDYKFYDDIVIKGIDASYLQIQDDSGANFTERIYAKREKQNGIVFEVPSSKLKMSQNNFSFLFYIMDSIVFSIPFLNHPISEQGTISLIEKDNNEVIYVIDEVLGKGLFSVDVYIDHIHNERYMITNFPYKLIIKNEGIHNYRYILRNDKEILDNRELFCIDLRKLENHMLKIIRVQTISYNKKNRSYIVTQDDVRRTHVRISKYLGDNLFCGQIVYRDGMGEYVIFKE